jgi:signal transduction histidine kinase
MLALDLEHRPELLELVRDIQKAQDYLHHLYEEVRGYAAPMALRRESCHLGELLDEVWLQLERERAGRRASLRQAEGGLDLHCEVDRHSIGQVLRNILENSLSACADPVLIEAQWSHAELAGRPGVRVALRDNGPGFTADARRRIFEPFFTTKTQGTGLGMAIAKRLVEVHGGEIAAGGDGPGAEIVLCLPRVRA